MCNPMLLAENEFCPHRKYACCSRMSAFFCMRRIWGSPTERSSERFQKTFPQEFLFHSLHRVDRWSRPIQPRFINGHGEECIQSSRANKVDFGKPVTESNTISPVQVREECLKVSALLVKVCAKIGDNRWDSSTRWIPVRNRVQPRIVRFSGLF